MMGRENIRKGKWVRYSTCCNPNRSRAMTASRVCIPVSAGCLQTAQNHVLRGQPSRVFGAPAQLVDHIRAPVPSEDLRCVIVQLLTTRKRHRVGRLPQGVGHSRFYASISKTLTRFKLHRYRRLSLHKKTLGDVREVLANPPVSQERYVYARPL